MANWYIGSTRHAAIAQWAGTTAYSEGDIVRQLASPSIGNERAFRCTTAGTSGASEPTWSLTVGSTTNDGTVVWTEITGNETYGWAAAIARIRSSSAWMAAGDVAFVSDNHSEVGSGAHYSINTNGTNVAPVSFLCVDDSASPPTALATGAVVSSPNSYNLNLNDYAVFYGITFNAGSGGSGASQLICNAALDPSYLIFDNCTLRLNNTSISSQIQFGSSSTASEQQGASLRACNLEFGNTSQSAVLRFPVRWYGGSVTGALFPNTLISNPGATAPVGSLVARGIDLSGMGSKTLVAASYCPSVCRFINCKLGSGAVAYSGTLTLGGGIVELVNCNAGDVNYSLAQHYQQGSVYNDAAIYRTGGASDGTTPVSLRMVSSSGATLRNPLRYEHLAFWNETVGNITPTVEVVTDGVTLTDAEAWIEVEYLGVSGFPQSAFASDRVANELATPANQTSSSETWTTTGLASPVKQSLGVTVAAAEKGWCRVTVCLAKPSSTMYACQKVVVN